jgi:hypothetical protein
MKTRYVIELASKHLQDLPGNVFDVLTVSEPVSIEAAVKLSKIVSKLSPLVGNLIEFNIVEFLNDYNEFEELGEWKRQDPGFPDTIFEGLVSPTPGFEVKAWFPLATEITARFKHSQNHFFEDQTYVAMLAWLPEHIIYGKPKIIDILITSGSSVAKARDNHYHNPPNYVVLEPENTSERTQNLQQTNTSGHKFQNEKGSFEEAEKFVNAWGTDGKVYKTNAEYQEQLRTLLRSFDYREDTNFAKMDRIRHAGIEEFKTRVYATVYKGLTVGEWNKLLSRGSEEDVAAALEKYLGIKEDSESEIVLDPD